MRNFILRLAIVVCSLILLGQSLQASQPAYFEVIEIGSETPGEILVTIDRPTLDMNGFRLEVVNLLFVDCLFEKAEFIDEFPADITITYKTPTSNRGLIKLKIIPLSDEGELPPTYKSIYIIKTIDQDSIIVPHLGQVDSVHKSIFPVGESSALQTDSATIIENIRMDAIKKNDEPEYKDDSPKESKTPNGTIDVYGYWRYLDGDGNHQPIRYAKVIVYDNEPFPAPAQHLRTGYTNSNGYYYFGDINNDDGLFQGGLDIFVEIHCTYWKESDKCVYVTDGNILDMSYWGKTDVEGDVADGSVSMGSWVVNDADKRGSWGLYDSGIEAYEFFKNASPSFRTDKVETIWPANDGPWFLYPSYKIEIPSGWEWESYAMCHEFSHATMYKMYNNNMPPHGSYSSHWYGMESDAGFALIEGWAEFAGKYITGSTTFESSLYADFTDNHDYDGAIVEGAVAEVLHDITDGANDDGVPYKIGNLMTILPDYHPNQIADIKSRWNQLGYSYQTDLQQVYYDQKIEQIPTYNVTISTAPSGRQITVDGQNYTAPKTFEWEDGSSHNIGVSSPQSGGTGTRYTYDYWSDGGSQSHQITITGSSTYTAYFDTEYQLTTSVNPSGSGSVSPQEGWYPSNQSVQVTANASSGWKFSYWSGGASGTSNPTWVTMSGPKNVVANFVRQTYQVTITADPSGRKVNVDGSDYDSPKTFTWEDGSNHNIGAPSPQAGGTGTQYVYDHWSDGGSQNHQITVTGNVTYTAYYNTEYQLTTSVNPSGSGSVSPQEGWYPSNQSVQVTASANQGWKFSHWSDGTSGTSNPTWVTMSGPKNVIANFAKQTYQVTITTSPSGRQITIDGQDYTAPQTFEWEDGSNHNISVPSPQSGGTGAQYVYNHWSDGGIQNHQIIVTGNATYTAYFNTEYQLTTAVDPSGSGTVSPQEGWYANNQSVQVTATANQGWKFSHWSDGTSGTSNPTWVTMSGPKNVVANFVKQTYQVTITADPSGRKVSVDGSDYDSPQTFTWEDGSTHNIGAPSPQAGGTGTQYVYDHWSDGGSQNHQITVTGNATYTAYYNTEYQLTTSVNPNGTGTVTPQEGWYASNQSVQVTANANQGWKFSHWSGGASGTSNPTWVTMSGPKDVVANFVKETYQVTITTDPSGRKVSVDGSDYDSPKTFTWEDGSTHNLGAPSPQAGETGSQYVFDNWSDGGNQNHQITVTGNATYTAYYNTEYRLTTSVNPNGTGTVTPQEGWYPNNESVQVTANANQSWKFSHWSGGASGTSNPTWVTMNEPKNAIANFVKQTYQVTITTDPSGRQVTVDGNNYDSPKTFTWEDGSTHNIGAPSPQAGATGTQFVYDHWSDGGNQNHQITVTGGTTCTAYFTTEYQLTASVNNVDWGTVTPQEGWYASNQSVQVTANPFQGYIFKKWSGDVPDTDTLNNPLTITMVSKKDIIANIEIQTDVTDNEADILPNRYALYQNHPNPFNPETRIEFTIPRTSHVRIEVFNLLGSRIKVLVDRQFSAGIHSVFWKGKDDFGTQVPSGIYLYMMKTDDFLESKKMILLK